MNKSGIYIIIGIVIVAVVIGGYFALRGGGGNQQEATESPFNLEETDLGDVREKSVRCVTYQDCPDDDDICLAGFCEEGEDFPEEFYKQRGIQPEGQ